MLLNLLKDGNNWQIKTTSHIKSVHNPLICSTLSIHSFEEHIKDSVIGILQVDGSIYEKTWDMFYQGICSINCTCHINTVCL